MLLSILENTLLERNLWGRVDRERQWKMLLQRPYRFYRRILDTRLNLRGDLALRLLRAIRLLRLFFSPQAVTELS